MNTAPPLHYRSLAETAAAMASGEVSSMDVTRHALARIEALEPRLHAFAELRPDAAMAEARAADERRASGEPLGALHGVPIAVKDLCAMAGTNTRAGGLFPTRFAPTDTATVVGRLRDAGAIIVGKSQLTEGAWGTHHPSIPAPVNPWSPEHWSGSSSSGSGVCVAAGMAYAAIGTDTAGSIRFPSACNHLVGLKPTWGRVSRHGVFPLSDTFDHVGPMARTVLDVALMYDAIAGADPLDPTSLDAPPPRGAVAARSGTLAGVRIGLDPVYALSPLDEATRRALESAIAQLAGAGAVIVEVALPDVSAFLARATAAAFVEAAISHAHAYPSQRHLYSDTYAALLDVGLATSAADYAAVAIWRREFAGHLARLFASVDLIVAPVLPVEPPPVAFMSATTAAPPLSSAPLTGYTLPFNLAGIPSLTLPMGRSPSGAPLGFQLLGPRLAEEALLSAGAAYEAVAGLAGRHPEL